jgi:hypothetical protein
VTDGAYSFLPWLRTGLATKITGAQATGRATIPVKLELTADALDPDNPPPPHPPVERPVQLYGPGDLIGVEARAISRMEPPPLARNFEPNYLAHIEFYEEDYAWRYSPAGPDTTTRRLTPWLALIVLTGRESATPEYVDGKDAGGPLPYIVVTNPDALQPAAELGAWAHVHVNGSLAERLDVDDTTPGGMGTVLSNLARVLREAPDSACSRVVCPRHLKPTTTYHAFLVPAFETGRRAGLGMKPAEIEAVGATVPSWDVPDMPLAGRLPYYHHWEFTTSKAGDFEYLARQLKPFEAKDPVGLRDMDAHRSPGFGLPELATPAVPNGVLRLGGALQLTESDTVIDNYENWDNYYGPQKPPGPPAPPYPNQWQRALAGLINLGEAYQHDTALDANTATQLPKLAGRGDPVITPPLYGRWHALTPKLLKNPDGTDLPAAETHNWVHRLNLDPRYRVAAHFGVKVVQARQEELMAAAWQQLGEARRANAWIRTAQLAREVGTILHGRHIAEQTGTVGVADAEPLASGRALTLTAPAHPKVLDRTGPAAAPGEVLAVGYKVARSRVAAAPVSPAMRRITRPRARLMKTLNTSLDTLLVRIDERRVSAAPPLGPPPGLVTPARVAEQVPDGAVEPALDELRARLSRVSVAAEDEGPPPLNVADTTGAVVTGLAADRTIMKNILAAVDLPERLAPKDGELTEVMAYPTFDMPVYTDLLAMSTDTFVPNLGLLPPNSVTLLEPNRRFIESYLVGLNHEMARELLWREYPTDQRGTPFRQFWDPRTAPAEPGETPARRRERLYDIPPIHMWGRTSPLGANHSRPKVGLVLVIRGELLRRYPNAAIYAHKAVWPKAPNQPPDMSGERTLADLPEHEDPPPTLVQLPIFEARVGPDITLLGFDLDAPTARGTGEGDDLGWFFVLKERPGDPRFGLDDDQPGQETAVEVWNDLTWGTVDHNGNGFIQFADAPTVSLDDDVLEQNDEEKKAQRLEDVQVDDWHPNVSAADVAYILFQAPVLVAVHAQEMLPDAHAEP